MATLLSNSVPITTPGVKVHPGRRHDWNSPGCSWAAAGAAASRAASATTVIEDRAQSCDSMTVLLLDDHGVAGLQLQRLALVVVVERVLVVELQLLRAAQDGDVLAVGEVGEA